MKPLYWITDVLAFVCLITFGLALIYFLPELESIAVQLSALLK